MAPMATAPDNPEINSSTTTIFLNDGIFSKLRASTRRQSGFMCTTLGSYIWKVRPRGRLSSIIHSQEIPLKKPHSLFHFVPAPFHLIQSTNRNSSASDIATRDHRRVHMVSCLGHPDQSN